jgi:hypothetical protein
MSRNKIFTGYLVIALVFLSCKKNESFDIKGDPEVRFFTNTTSFGNAPQNSINYSVINYPDVAGSGLINLSANIPATVKFAVFATKPVSEDVMIGAELDNSLIAEYNALHNTKYMAFPAGILNTTGLTAHITKGTTTSADSITVTTDVTGINVLSEKAYMAPIKLTTVSNNGVGQVTTSETKITYIVANVELRKIKYLATAAEAQGALVTPRTTWTAAFDPAPATTGSIFDGSTTTYTRWAASPGQVDVNMQATKNVTGIRVFHGNSATFTPTQVDVYLSNDGINFDFIGSPLKANITFASNYNYILFYKAIPAKYIRLKLYYSTSTNTQNLRVTEFDVYAN